MLNKFSSNEKTTKAEKIDFLFSIIYGLCIRNSVHFDVIEDWFYASLTKRDIDSLEYFHSGSKESALSGLIKLFSENITEYQGAYQEWFFEGDISSREDLLMLLKITPKKINDLLVVINFNLNFDECVDDICVDRQKVFFSSSRLKSNREKGFNEFLNNYEVA